MKNVFFVLLVCFCTLNAKTQFKISGTVTHNGDLNEPLAGATVQIVNTNYRTITSQDGKFSLMLNPGEYNLVVTYIGYRKFEKTIIIAEKDEIIDIALNQDVILLASYEIIATRANPNSAMAISEINKKTIEAVNLGADLPYVLDQTPSVVVNSDAGNGIGYTGMRIRGSDQTRINVTVNGIPVNDAESQGVFWVDFPDLASSVNSIQIQRGLGTSTNGAGAFGGTVNIQTLNDNDKASATFSNSYGSFNSRKHTLQLGTGKLKIRNTGNNPGVFSFDSRLSWIASDGYIDRATSDLKSFYLAGAYHNQKNSVRLIAFSGKEKTYQAWYGVPLDSLETNRTFNPYTYKNETDNYIQSNYQLLYNFIPGSRLRGNISFHYTKGAGYYEQYKEDEMFSNYNLEDVIIGNDTITTTNLIRQRWLDNDFYGTVYSLNFMPNNKFELLFGGGYNQYLGKHFGEVIWLQYASNSEINHRYYDDKAKKQDFNNYLKAYYWVNSRINIFADLQIRSVKYEFTGFDESLNFVNQNVDFLFFNPKAGLTYYLPKNQVLYTSFAMGNKEPNRNDFTESTPSSRPVHEQLIDFEAGYKISKLKFAGTINIYNMIYKNQLVLTGKINDVGAYTRQNIAESFRRGIELEGGFKYKGVLIAGNLTLSQNKINNYTEYIDNWDTWGQDSVFYSQTDIAFSPSVIAGGNIGYSKMKVRSKTVTHQPGKDSISIEYGINILPKYVGQQYIDNTSSDERSLNGYFTTDLRFSLTRKNELTNHLISLNFMIRNVFNELYSANAWVYRYSYLGENYTDYGFFPQAGINYMIGLTIGF